MVGSCGTVLDSFLVLERETLLLYSFECLVCFINVTIYVHSIQNAKKKNMSTNIFS